MAAGNADGSVIIKAVLNTGGIKNALGKLGGTVKSLAGSVGGITKQTANLRNQFEGLGSTAKKVGGIIASVFAVRQIINFSKEAIELGSDLSEVQNVVDNVFTTMTSKVDEFATTAAQAYGLSETMAKRYVGTFGAMAKAFGFTEKEAYDMSTTLTGLAGDVASFYNLDQDTAYTKLKSVFSGETESLKDLGIVMSQSALDAYALEQGLGKTTAQMTEQEKVALRYRFILDQLSTASGDFARTSDGWANQVRILRLQVDSLKASLGQGLINLLTPALKVINAIIGRLATLANAFKAFTELITGKKSSGQTGGAAAGLADVSGAAADAADSTGSLADATKDAAGATKDAAKQQKAYLSGLDEMKKFSLPETSGDSGGSGGGGGGSNGSGGSTGGLIPAVEAVDYGKLADGNSVVDELGESFQKLADIIKSKDWEGLGKFMADGINAGMQKLYDFFNWSNLGPKITEFTDAVVRTINSFVDNLDAELGGRTLGTIINTAVNTINNLRYGINWEEIGQKIADGFNGLMDEVDFNKLGQAISGKFYMAWQTFKGFIENFHFEALGTHIAELMEGMMDGAPKLTDLGNTICKLVNGAFDTLGAWLKRFPFKKFATNISDGINTMIMGIDWEADGQTFNELLVKFGGLLTDIVAKVKWEELGSGIGTFLSQIDWAKHLATAWNLIKNIVLGLARGVGKTSGGRFLLGLIAFKVTTTMILPFINSLAAAFTGTTVTSALSTSIGGSLVSAAKSAAATAGPIVAGILAGIIAFEKTTYDVGENPDEMMPTTVYQDVIDALDTLSSKAGLTKEKTDELRGSLAQVQDVENWGEAIDLAAESLYEAGISAEDLNAATDPDKFGGNLTSIANRMSDTAFVTQELQKSVDELGESYTRNAGTLDFSLTSYEDTNDVFERMFNVLCNLYNQGGDTAAMLPVLDEALTKAQSSGDDAQQAFDRMRQALESAGYDTEAFILAMQKEFPEAVPPVVESTEQIQDSVEEIGSTAETTQEKVDTSMDGIKTSTETKSTEIADTVSSNAQQAADDTVAAWDAIAEEAGESMESVAGAAELYSGDAADSLNTNWTEAKKSTTNEWGGSTTEIEKNLNSQNAMVGDKLRSMHHVVDWYNQKYKSMFADAWSEISSNISMNMNNIGNAVSATFYSMTNSVISAFQGMASGISNPLNDFIWKLNSLIVGAQNAQNAIASLLSFNIRLDGFMAQKVGWSSMYLNIPQRYTNYRVPYLASGAVIPPNAPFMAMLGDQKRGNNIEAPEDLIRKIVREETGGRDRSYTFIAQLNGRTLFSQMVTEAELRQMQTGRNPFELT